MGPILVVEDDADTRELLTHALRDEGFAVLASDEGRKGMELAIGLRPSLVLLDLEMDGMDGRTFLQLRRDVPQLATLPVVLITGAPTAGLEADAVLPKPVRLAEVLATVRRLLRRAS